MVEYAQRDVPRSARGVNAAYRPSRARVKKADERVLQEEMNAERHGVIREVIAGCDRVEHTPHEALFVLARRSRGTEHGRSFVVHAERKGWPTF